MKPNKTGKTKNKHIKVLATDGARLSDPVPIPCGSCSSRQIVPPCRDNSCKTDCIACQSNCKYGGCTSGKTVPPLSGAKNIKIK